MPRHIQAYTMLCTGIWIEMNTLGQVNIACIYRTIVNMTAVSSISIICYTIILLSASFIFFSVAPRHSGHQVEENTEQWPPRSALTECHRKGWTLDSIHPTCHTSSDSRFALPSTGRDSHFPCRPVRRGILSIWLEIFGALCGRQCLSRPTSSYPRTIYTQLFVRFGVCLGEHPHSHICSATWTRCLSHEVLVVSFISLVVAR